MLARLELTLHENKTSMRNARQERFDFLGYTFGPHIHPRGGGRYRGYRPSKQSGSRIQQKVGELLDRRNGAPWEEVRQKLHQKLQGWRQYFRVGSTRQAYRAVDEYGYDRVRNFLRRRHQVSSQGIRQFPAERVYGTLGVFRLQGPRAAPYGSLRCSQSESRMLEMGTSGLMSGDGKRGGATASVPAPILDSTPLQAEACATSRTKFSDIGDDPQGRSR